MVIRKFLILWSIASICFACDTGNLIVIANLPGQLNEVSGNEIVHNSELYWVLEDGNNEPRLFGLDSTGLIRQSVLIKNATNIDWEDLAADIEGNLYIGDFGNNRRLRSDYQIYKIHNEDLFNESAVAEKINFVLPKDENQYDFEAFIVKAGYFYIFSKESGSFKTFRVPNSPGNHRAKHLYSYNLDGRSNKITSADISEDGKTLILLNHNKLWKITDFKEDDFFNGHIEEFLFNHSSQKEGICFEHNTTVIISDENRGMGGNLYKFDLDRMKD